MEKFPKSLAAKMAQREQENALRTLRKPTPTVDFSSNDYLGFGADRSIFDAAHNYLLEHGFTQNGSTGSRLISGNHGLYVVVEEMVAKFHNTESALIFNSGYDANVGFFSSVSQKGDVVLYDEYIHASIRDGLRLSNAATYKFPHNDLEALEALVKRHEGKEVYIVTESVFSMDGDSPNLQLMSELCNKYGCRLVIDEAHAIGVFGQKGEGLVQSLELENSVFARIATFGKGPGCHGAAVLGSQQLKDYLVNFARSLIYTTALPPHSLSTILAAYSRLENAPEREMLAANILFFRAELQRLGLTDIFIESHSAIHCAVVPGNERVRSIAAALAGKGFGVKAILSPTVPAGSERLRFCLHSYNTEREITGVLGTLKQLLQP
ncbi:8-amino-7-oxononanoate synthase [Flavobacterium sp. MFBS3-15]|uniref:aminotransferase class I/II-fold pyridoxal phosphate-dependent enzyme n=1 Tax=Flavobacterium sp. MFBS3-15 TaxID=2989816 RepID=UPI0022355E1E|nr:8-amino-7-oxononanoate synthase [Flavobacterium sp. MFBS3-15]MCW4470308.1 8-amino-7-oxononanoate synthase [Flavobacterium sp. MFBS3-15]